MQVKFFDHVPDTVIGKTRIHFGGTSLKIAFTTMATIFFAIMCPLAESQTPKFVNYPGPAGAPRSSRFTMEVNNHAVFVYDSQITNRPSAFAYFDFSGTVQVKVTFYQTITRAIVHPFSANIVPSIVGNSLTFTLTEPRKLALEINENWPTLPWDNVVTYPLLIFANSLEENPPQAGDPNVIYYGPGVHEAGLITLTSGKTAYIAGGAYVRGRITANGATNIKVLGRGILNSTGINPGWLNNAAFFPRNCQDVEFKGIIINDFPEWTVVPYKTNNLVIDNVKIVTGRSLGTDGIDLCSCRYVTINDVFIRNADDSIAIKAETYHDANNRTPSSDITITNSILWSMTANAVEIGFETYTPNISNVYVRNLDLIFSEAGISALSIHNGADALVSNVRYEDIRCEYVPNVGWWSPFEFNIEYEGWGDPYLKGYINGVYVKNFTLYNSPPTDDFRKSEVYGYKINDDIHLVENITFENLRMGGKLILNAQDGYFDINQFARNITFLPAQGSSPPTPPRDLRLVQ